MPHFDFPSSPSVGATYSPGTGLPVYRWDGEKWRAIVNAAATANILISDTPPGSPVDGQLWWESDSGNLFVRYNDGDSTQWVLVGQFNDLAGMLRYDAAQVLTAAQRAQAISNIDGAMFQGTASNPGSFTSTSGVQLGLGSTFKLTPVSTGRFLVVISAAASATVATAGINSAIRYGSGTPPAFNSATAGNAVSANNNGMWSAVANAVVPIVLMAIVTGLTPGTQYWFDLNVSVSTGNGNITGPSCTIMEF